MKKIALLVLLVLAMGAAGFAAGTYIVPPKDQMAGHAGGDRSSKEVFYKLPLGRLTVQVIKPAEFWNIRFKMDVYIIGASNFERMSDGLSRTKMREEVMQHMLNMAETKLWANDFNTFPLEPEELARKIARNLYHRYPMVRTARITDFVTSQVER